MKKRLFFVLNFVLILALTLTLPAAAGAPMPLTPQPGGGGHPAPTPPDDLQAYKKTLKPTKTAGDIPADSIPLGAPGTSFRYLTQFGETALPYTVDLWHINQPTGMFIKNNMLYVAEEYGARVLKFNLASLGTPPTAVSSIGHAGIYWDIADDLDNPWQVVVDASGNQWVGTDTALKEFDSSNNFVKSLPAADQSPWQTGSDNGHFDGIMGVAFGPGGYLYVSDAKNDRIQVYDVSSDPPTYITTIGQTGVTHTDNNGFNYPAGLNFDSAGDLFVSDSFNTRVQRCTSTAPWTSWSCQTFFGEPGVWGDASDLTHINWSPSTTIANNILYINDSNNKRILACGSPTSATLPATCSIFINPSTDPAHTNFASPGAMVVDTNGNYYIADNDNSRIQVFKVVSGVLTYQRTLGVYQVPYLPGTRLNVPNGIAVAPDGSMYVAESKGFRLVKLNASGAQQWVKGVAGVFGSDTTHFGNVYGTGLEGNPALDASGNVYAPDSGNGRIRIFSAAGADLGTLGTGGGQGPYNFNYLAGLAINPLNGDIYAADRDNQRIQVYTSARVYKATIGLTGSQGDDNWHFNQPYGVAVDKNGSLFVADKDNHRVQKCSLSAGGYTCATFAGMDENINNSNQFNHFRPKAVAVDAAGKVYVTDEWNSRVQVFDANGAYLTTIGGVWGLGNGDMVNAEGIAVDLQGNVYVTDGGNHRVQKFAPGVAGWKQVNINGFGNVNDWIVGSLAAFGSYLYAGTGNGQISRSKDGVTWVPVVGSLDQCGGMIDHLYVFAGKLYASVANYNGCGGSIYRSADGTNWEKVTPGAFNANTNPEIEVMSSYNNQIYFATWADGSHGVEIWRSGTGNANAWSKIEANGFGDSKNQTVLSFKAFKNFFYVSTLNPDNGVQVLRSASGNPGTWTQVNTSGFGGTANRNASLEVFGGYLYAATGQAKGGGSQLWRCQVCDGTDWSKLTGPFVGTNIFRTPGILAANGKLYIIASDWLVDGSTGIGIFESANGTTWTASAPNGFGNKNNIINYYSNAMAIFGQQLFIGTMNSANGGQIWRATANITAQPTSIGAQDGWILESAKGSGVGGSLNAIANTFTLGDDAANKQYRAILSFDTSSIPAGAVINSVTLKIKQSGSAIGVNPFTVLGTLQTDIKKGAFGLVTLELADFKTAATAVKAAPFSATPASGWYTATFNTAGKAAINPGGITQVRLYFNTATNSNNQADNMLFVSGNASSGAPVLTINYTLP